MKKTFCDLCGNWMEYSGIPHYVKGSGDVVNVKTTEGIPLEVRVSVKFEILEVPNGEHIDICHECRMKMLDKLDIRLKAEGFA